ncbi:MAG: hypothetical protein WCC11_09205 [Gammaproteobacteria bacterium]
MNVTTGGNSSVGTISTNGLYTAPDLPPPGGQVTITAIEQSNTALSGTTTLSIGYSNASLNGAYAFNMNGLNNGAPWSAIGEFNANGAGQLGNGLEDINDGTTPVQPKTPFAGTYAINPDGLGTAVLGTVDIQFVLLTGGQASLISTDAGTVIAGNISPQSQAAGSVTNLGGPYVFSFSGENTSNQSITMLGRVIATTGGAFTTAGTEDVNGPSILSNIPVSGSYSFDDQNHGTATLTDIAGSHNYSFYVVSASDIEFLSSDSAQPLSGNLSPQQPITFSDASLNAPYVFFLGGNSPTSAYMQAGQFNPFGSGSLGTITEDVNTLGSVGTYTPTGTYTFDPSGNGRGTLTINNQGANTPTTYVFYMSSPSQGQFMATNSNIVASGLIISQQQGTSFNTDSLEAHYGFTLFSAAGPASPSLGLGTLALDGQGNLSGNLLLNAIGSIPPVLSLTGTYMLNTSVRGTATLNSSGGGSSPFAVYPITPDEFVLIGTNALSPYLGTAIIQY